MPITPGGGGGGSVPPIASVFPPGHGPDTASRETKIKSAPDHPLDGRWRRKRKHREVKMTRADQEALSLIENRYNPFETVKYGLEKQWLLNISFLTGYQYHVWSEYHRGLVFQRRAPQWRIREVRNFIRPYVDRRTAYLSSFRPRFRVRPNSSDNQDRRASEANEKIIDSYWDLLEMGEKMQEVMNWVGSTGNGFLKIQWDAASGESWTDVSVNPETGRPEFDKETGETLMDLYYEGDLAVEVVSPFQIYVDPLAQRPSDLQWIIQTTRRPMEWVEKHFPEKAHLVPVDFGQGYGDEKRHNERVILNLVGPGGYYSGLDAATLGRGEWVTVRELWQVPSREYPKGRLIIEAGGVVLENKDNPTPGGQLPFVWFRDLIVPGRVWGQSVADNMITPQRNYNRLVSSYLEHIVMTARAKILEPALSGLPDTAFITEVGERLKYNGPQAPAYLVPPPLPAESDTEMMRIKQDLDLISSSYGAARGQYQGKLSGTAINLLVEQDLKSKEPILARVSASLEKFGKIALSILQQEVTEERVVKVIGKQRQFDISHFTGQDILNNTDVIIEVDSIMPKSKTLALQEIQILGQVGLLNPNDPTDRARAYAMLQYEDDQIVLQDKNVDRREAEIENDLMANGQLVPPKYYENHDVHVALHVQFMKSDEFKSLPEGVQAVFNKHLQAHHEFVYPQGGKGLVPEGEEAV